MCAHCWHPTHAPALAGDTVVCCLCHVRERPTGPRELAALDHCWGAREVEADLRALMATSEMEQDTADTRAMTEAWHQILEAHAPTVLAQIQVGAPPVGT